MTEDAATEAAQILNKPHNLNLIFVENKVSTFGWRKMVEKIHKSALSRLFIM